MKLKRYTLLCRGLLMVSVAFLTISCGSKHSSGLSTFDTSIVQPADDYIDPRDGSVYRCVRIGDQIWMTSNLQYLPPRYNDDGCHTWNESSKYIGMTTEEYRDNLWKSYEVQVDADNPFDPPVYPDIFPDITDEDVLTITLETYDENEAKLIDAEYDIVGIMEAYKAGAFPKKLLLTIIRNNDPFFMRNFVEPKLFELRKALVFSDETIKAMAKQIFEEHEENSEEYKETYGYLYSYEGALKAIPEGWRLPSDEDWKKLEMALGLSASEANQMDEWRGAGLATLLNIGGKSGFNAIPAGGNVYTKGAKKNMYVKKGQNWYFWSSTKYAVNDSVDQAIFRMGSDVTDKVWRGSTRIDNGYRDVTYSVRCVKDLK